MHLLTAISKPRSVQHVMACCGLLWRSRLVESGVVQRGIEFDLVVLIGPSEAWARAANGERQFDAVYGAVILKVHLHLHLLLSEIGDEIQANEQSGLAVEIEFFRLPAWRRGFDHISLAIVQLSQA